MALVHYAGNSGIVAIGQALKTGEPIWQTWRKHYLWTSITYFAGAITAAVIAGLVKSNWLFRIRHHPTDNRNRFSYLSHVLEKRRNFRGSS